VLLVSSLPTFGSQQNSRLKHRDSPFRRDSYPNRRSRSHCREGDWSLAMLIERLHRERASALPLCSLPDYNDESSATKRPGPEENRARAGHLKTR
jgi:hypothetical protein